MKLFDAEFVARLLTAVSVGSLFALLLLYGPLWCFIFVVVLCSLYVATVELPRLKLSPLPAIVLYCFLAASFCAAVALYAHTATRAWFIGLCMLVCVHDTAAYCIGRLFGSHALCPTISPRKTWEGFIGGYLITSCIACLMTLFMRPWPLIITWGLVLMLPLVATAGDLSVSWLKRRAGIKDTGALLPGHGGLLDRLDSILPATLMLYLMFLLFGDS